MKPLPQRSALAAAALFLIGSAAAAPGDDPTRYPSADRLTASPGDTAYFVDPVTGDDAQPGTDRTKPWKSIARVDGAARSEIILGGRMIGFVNDRCQDLTWSGLVFDLKRPTVSEFRVMEAKPEEVTIRVAEGSTYEITGGRFAWTGDQPFQRRPAFHPSPTDLRRSHREGQPRQCRRIVTVR